jgi:hypothetical protein
MKSFQLAYNELETSHITRISVSTLQKSRKAPYTNIKNGKCPPFYKNGGSVLYRWADVMEFMDNRKVIGKPEVKSQSNKAKSKGPSLQEPKINEAANEFNDRLKF